MAQIKSCTDCTFYKRGYCTRKTRNVLSDGEAVFCDYYTPIGQVAISDLGLLGGQLKEWQIPSSIIDSTKIADSAVKTAKIDNSAITTAKIATGAVDSSKIADGTIITADLENFIVTNQKVATDAAIAESKLSLTYSTQALMDAILLRELLSNKNAINGYCGLDAGAKVPLARLNPITNVEVAAGAAIDESKLNLNYPTHSNANDHAESHGLDDTVHTGTLSWAKVSKTGSSLADLATRFHSQLTNIGPSDHHNESHTLASHSTKAHAELTNIGRNDHDNISDTAFGASWDGVHDIAPSKDAVYDKIAQLEKLEMYGAGNAAWIPMVFAGQNDGGTVSSSQWGGWFRNDGALDMHLAFTIGIPYQKGTLALTLTDLRVVVNDADAGDYITRIRVWSDDVGKLDENNDITTPNTYDFDITDCSPTQSLMCYIDCVNTDQADLKFVVFIKGYYS